jgi:hypothetical protein
VEIGKNLEIDFGHNKNTFLFYVFKKVETETKLENTFIIQ